MKVPYCDQCKKPIGNIPHFEIKEMLVFDPNKGVGSAENVDFCGAECFTEWTRVSSEAPPIVQQLKPPGPLVGLDGKKLMPNG